MDQAVYHGCKIGYLVGKSIMTVISTNGVRYGKQMQTYFLIWSRITVKGLELIVPLLQINTNFVCVNVLVLSGMIVITCATGYFLTIFFVMGKYNLIANTNIFYIFPVAGMGQVQGFNLCGRRVTHT